MFGKMMFMNKIDISVVVPAYNEEKYIGDCLKSLINQQTDKSYEVIVVDNNSQDDTAKVALGFKDKLNLRVILEKKQGRGAARARGFREALGDIILSTDADTILYPGWIKTLVSPIGGEIAATITSSKVNDLGFLKNTLFNLLQPFFTLLFMWVFGHYWLGGFSFAILKTAYKKSGGFNVNIGTYEDADLAFRVSKIGKIKFINKPVIFSGRRFKKSLLAGLYQYIHTFIQAFLLKKEPDLNNIR